MLNSKLRETMEKIIKDAFKGVSIYGLNDEDEDYIYEWLGPNCNYPYTVHHGATKMCVILAPLTDCGYVVKIPLQYTAADSDEYYDNYEGGFCELENAQSFWRSSRLLDKIATRRGFYEEDDDTSHWDYCRIEARITEMIENTYMEQFFAKTYYICDIDSVPVYVQEYIPSGSWEWTIPEETKKRYNNSHITPSREIGSDLAMRFMVNRNDEELKYFQNFMNFFENMHIDDMHYENVRTKDGKLYVIDYSGFDW